MAEVPLSGLLLIEQFERFYPEATPDPFTHAEP